MPDAPLVSATDQQVWTRLCEVVEPLPPERLAVRDAFGRILAADVAAGFDYPPFDRAVMDGYAVRCADFGGGAARLRCLGLAAAGAVATHVVEPGTCLQINTGGPLPAGADAIVVVEKSQRESGDWVSLEDSPRVGQNIEKRGGVARRGATIAMRGTRIQAGTTAALISAGATEIPCFTSPRVALLCTGDELVDAGGQLGDAQIFDSNSAVLEVLIRDAGGQVTAVEKAGDTRQKLLEAIQKLHKCELLIITGGMSKGSHDLVPAVLEELGVEWLVTSLDLKPGKPTRIGRTPGGAWVLGLPGNPVSCAVCFLLFGRAILEGLQGLGVHAPPRLQGRLTGAVPANGARPMYHPASWFADESGGLLLCPIPWRGSGEPFGLATANALLVRDRNAPPAAVGEQAWFVPLGLPAAKLKE